MPKNNITISNKDTLKISNAVIKSKRTVSIYITLFIYGAFLMIELTK